MRFKLTVLQRPWGEGGLACPDLHKYYLAAQLCHTHNWQVLDESNPAVLLEAACLGSYEALWNLLYRGFCLPFPLKMAMKAILRAWTVALSMRPFPLGISPHTTPSGLTRHCQSLCQYPILVSGHSKVLNM